MKIALLLLFSSKRESALTEKRTIFTWHARRNMRRKTWHDPV